MIGLILVIGVYNILQHPYGALDRCGALYVYFILGIYGKHFVYANV